MLDVGSVAVVGNGPISKFQRSEIAAAERIVRFNAMDNTCALSVGLGFRG